MNIRSAFLASPKFELRIPGDTGTGESAFFRIAEDWRPALASAANFQPEVAFVFDPLSIPGEALQALPGIKVGVVTQPLTPGELSEALRRQRTGIGVLEWFTWFEEPPPEVRDLPFLSIVATSLDTRRLPSPPNLEQVAIAVPAWARPPGLSLDAELVASEESWPDCLEKLSRCGVLVYYSSEPLQLRMPLLPLALAHGLLLVSNQAFPPECGIEQEDEYLVRPVKDWARVVEKEQKGLGYFRAVRARAFQKARELFDASTVFRRLAVDATILKATCRTSPTRRQW